MTKNDKQNWEINITNLADEISSMGRKDIVESIFKKYDAHGFWDLSPSNYWDVFGDLDFIANDLRE